MCRMPLCRGVCRREPRLFYIEEFIGMQREGQENEEKPSDLKLLQKRWELEMTLRLVLGGICTCEKRNYGKLCQRSNAAL